MLCAYDAAVRLASIQRNLSLFNEHISHSEHLSKNRDDREKFGGAVGRILMEVQKDSKQFYPDPNPVVNPLAKKFLSSRMHSNLERCIGGLAKNLPFSAEALSLALYYINELQHLYTDVVNCWTLDRMFATAFVIASKFAYDEVYPNTFYAARLGLTLLELNNLEFVFLSLFGFAINPDRKAWILLHCCIARIAFEPEKLSTGARGSCPSIEVPLLPLKRNSFSNSGLTSSATTASPSPVTPMITSVGSPGPKNKNSSLRNHGITISVTSIMSPESSSASPKPVDDALKSHGKRHSHYDLDDKPSKHHHRHRHQKKPSLLDTD